MTVAKDRRFYDWFSVATDGTATKLDAYFGEWYGLRNADVGKQLVVEVSWFEDGERKHIRSAARPPGGIRGGTQTYVYDGYIYTVTTTENTAHTFTLSELGDPTATILPNVRTLADHSVVARPKVR